MNSVYNVDEIRDRLRPVFITKPVYKAILFGSYAKGIATENSDIDIVIDSKGELRGLRFYGVLDDMVEALDKSIDLIDISEIRPGAPIMDDILRQGVILYERQG